MGPYEPHVRDDCDGSCLIRRLQRVDDLSNVGRGISFMNRMFNARAYLTPTLIFCIDESASSHVGVYFGREES